MFTLLLARVYYLQIVKGEDFSRLSENNCIRLQYVEAPRGLIFDRNGELLVENRPAFDLSIILKDAGSLDRTIEKLSRHTSIDAAEIRSRIAKKKGRRGYKPILIRHDIGRDMLAAVEVHKFDLPGVVVKIRPRRHYIHRKSAAHLIGYLSEISPGELKNPKYSAYRGGDYIGKFGVEKAFERFLRGESGGRQVEVNAAGQVVNVLNEVKARPGHNLFMTIDHALQKKAEALLENVAGAVVAMAPHSGEILAMASSPSFDQNAFVDGMTRKQWGSIISNSDRPMRNKAIQAEYPPASTYKIVTAIAALEEGVIDERSRIHCPGHYEYGDRVFRCWKTTGHGRVTLEEALGVSCDVFFYHLGQKIGVEKLSWYAKACGLGALTGVSLVHEEQGLVPTAAWKKRKTGIPWRGGETLSVAIGQGYNLATPLQLAVLISAVANGGVRHRPLIVKRIEDAGGAAVEKSAPVVMGKLHASPKTLSVVRSGLWRVVNKSSGTAWAIRAPGVVISGKTGTAQLVSRKVNEDMLKKKPAHLKAHALFVAYAPHKDPKIAISVVVEHGEHGAAAAGTIARDLVHAYLNNGGRS
ncbi:Beta-lactamase [Candidatus Desulfarcum epimagneticum]|uniref:Beta-lactamase n=1 Tax=uncultured Desulfobacteraceae bacterium TaxID=218296 RepID=A0A484HJ21_9BACT|nr:Beta-lactamase [uncultured Desulfobacteraceae bacterium]